MSREEAILCIEEGRDLFRRRIYVRTSMWLVALSILAWLIWLRGERVLAIFCSVMALTRVLVLVLPKDDTERLLKLLDLSGPPVVWIYPVEWAIRPFGVHLFRRSYLKMHFEDGHTEDLRIPPLDLHGWMRCLNVLFPQASFGYTEEREREFRQHTGQNQ